MQVLYQRKLQELVRWYSKRHVREVIFQWYKTLARLLDSDVLLKMNEILMKNSECWRFTWKNWNTFLHKLDNKRSAKSYSHVETQSSRNKSIWNVNMQIPLSNNSKQLFRSDLQTHIKFLKAVQNPTNQQIHHCMHLCIFSKFSNYYFLSVFLRASSH